jgi:alkylation response protein AidB-like acyl-CoA dehydrogenase
MNLSLGPDEDAIMQATADALAQEFPAAQGRAGVDAGDAERRGLALAASLGWLGFACGEGCGGSGASAADAALIAMELGRGVAPMPILAGMLAARVAEAAGDPATAAAIIAGERAAGMLAADGLLFGAGAGLALRIDPDGAQLMRIDQAAPALSFDPTITMARAAPGACVVRAEGGRWLLECELLIAAMQTGVAEAALAQSVAHATLREQFGRAIGGFQAVRHKCADMALRCARARAQVLFASVALRDGRADAAETVLCAAILAHEAANENARANIFIHGAQGVTAENAAHLYLKRAIVTARMAMTPRALKDALAAVQDKEARDGA